MKAFLLGMREFRSGITTHFEYPAILKYDAGRELMHRVTFRKWDW